jgi:hypothetical protein
MIPQILLFTSSSLPLVGACITDPKGLNTTSCHQLRILLFEMLSEECSSYYLFLFPLSVVKLVVSSIKTTVSGCTVSKFYFVTSITNNSLAPV